MNPVAFIICAYGICFNPNQITYMEPQGNITSNCRISFAKRSDNITVDASCEEIAAKINQQLSEKLEK